MRWTSTLVALSLMTFTLAAATPVSAASCIDLVHDVSPVTPAPHLTGSIQVCDTTRDGDFDTVRTQTNPVHSQSSVSVTQEEKRTPTSQSQHTNVDAMVTAAGPLDPLLWMSLQADDHHDHGNIDQVIAEMGAQTAGPLPYSMYTFLGAWDANGDGALNLYGFLICDVFVGCLAPGNAFDAIELAEDTVENPPNLVFYVDGVGWIP